MPESGPYSLLILSFTIFSFVTWQLQSSGADLALGFCAGLLMLLATVRLLIRQIQNIITSPPQDIALASFDCVLTAAFLALLTWTAIRVLNLATTVDPVRR